MFRLDSSELPEAVADFYEASIAATLGIPPEPSSLVVSTYADYGEIESFTSPLGSPDYVGKLYSVSFTPNVYSISEVRGVSAGFSEAPVLEARPGNFWLDDVENSARLYSSRDYQVEAGDAITVEAIVSLPLPAPSTYLYSFSTEGWDISDVDRVEVDGYLFTPAANPLLPNPAEFVSSGDRITLYGSAAVLPRTGTEVYIYLTSSISVIESKLGVVSFELSDQGITEIDAVDYMGRVYYRSDNAFNPLPFTFTWDRSSQLLNLYMPVFISQGIKADSQSLGSDVRRSIGTMTFNREV